MTRNIIRSAAGPWGSVRVLVAHNVQLQRFELYATINGAPIAKVPYFDTEDEAIRMANDFVDEESMELAKAYERRHVTVEELRQGAQRLGLKLSEKVLFFHSYFVVKWVNAMPLSWSNRMNIGLAELEQMSQRDLTLAQATEFKPAITDFGTTATVEQNTGPFTPLH